MKYHHYIKMGVHCTILEMLLFNSNWIVLDVKWKLTFYVVTMYGPILVPWMSPWHFYSVCPFVLVQWGKKGTDLGAATSWFPKISAFFSPLHLHEGAKRASESERAWRWLTEIPYLLEISLYIWRIRNGLKSYSVCPVLFWTIPGTFIHCIVVWHNKNITDIYNTDNIHYYGITAQSNI